MRVCIVDGEVPRLYLEPETMRDQMWVTRLLEKYVIVGHGANVNGAHLHVEIPLCRLDGKDRHIEFVRDQFKRMGETDE